MNKADQKKKIVREKYAEIAAQDKAINASSCCGATASSNKIYNIMMDDYSEVKGYNPDADLGLGCGLPTAFAQIAEGDIVLDLGSGAGNDCFVARHETGSTGKVIGVDFVDQMIDKARINAEKLGYNNVEFRYGDIEQLPVSDGTVDVVVSNCVLNLVPNKSGVISEIHRVLKEGGHFSISDIVLVGDLPDGLQSDAEMYAGCVSGAIQMQDYLGLIEQQGFVNVNVQKKKTITLPEDILEKYLSDVELENFKSNNIGIFSITVYAEKPGAKKSKPKVSLKDLQNAECLPDTGCC